MDGVMGRRHMQERAPRYHCFDCLWNNARQERYHKRRLSKTRRRFIKSVLRDGEQAYLHMRALRNCESTVNWKAW